MKAVACRAFDQPGSRTSRAPDHRLMMRLYAISGWPRMRAIKGIPSGAAAWRETLALAIEPRRCRLPASGNLGALGRPRQQWLGGAGARPRGPLYRHRGARGGFTGSDDRTTDSRALLALPWGFRRITSTNRADARALRATIAALARHPIPIRSTTDRANHPGSGAVARGPLRSSG